jgi:hypothetical protein
VSPARRRGNSMLLEASTGDMRLLPPHHLYERSPSVPTWDEAAF